MKPFDLEKAIAGAPVVDAAMSPVRLICHDRKSPTKKSLVVLAKYKDREETRHYYRDGTDDHHPALFMPSVLNSGWVNIYYAGLGHYTGNIHESEKSARDAGSQESYYVATVQVEWEE